MRCETPFCPGDEQMSSVILCQCIISASSMWESSVRGSTQWNWGEREQEKQGGGLS